MHQNVIKIELEDRIIELFDEQQYKPNSADNAFTYDQIYLSEEIEVEGYQPTSMIGIIARDKANHDIVLSSAIVGEVGGATRLSEESFLTEGNQLIFCICNQVYALDLLSLELQWKLEADMATCFSLYRFGKGIVVYGELQISLLGFDGGLLWQFGASDIFVTPDNQEAFRIEGDLIVVKDWSGDEHWLNEKGEVVKRSRY